jgi:hypothetical protein
LRADDITYNVDVSVGAGSLTGQLTLNGVGTPSVGVVGYDLTLFDGTYSVVLTAANSQFEDANGTGLDITSTEITFNWSSTDQFTLLAPPPASPPPPVGPSITGPYDGVFCFSAKDGGDCAGQGENGYASIGSVGGDGPDTDLQAESGVEVFAVATPEPGTGILLLFGTGLLLVVMRKRIAHGLTRAS